jgi:predicted dehydrogenase
MVPPAPAEAAGTRPGDGRRPQTLAAGVVGVGMIARQHLACLAELPGATVTGVCDLSPAVAESAAERFGVARHFTDHRAMLAELQPDVVHVTTPPGPHHRIAMDALEAGAHVIVEKPIVARADELDSLLAEAERRGRVAIENYNYVFNPQVRELRRLIATGELGQLTHVEVDLAVDILGAASPFADRNRPHPALALPGGAIADFLPHLASLAWFLVGEQRALSAIWSQRRAGSPLEVDELRALLDAERGTAALSFSSTSQPDGFWLRAHGSRMRFEANLFEPRMTLERARAAPTPLLPVLNGLSEIAAVGRAAVGGLWGKLSGAPGVFAGLWELIAQTYDAIERGAPPPVTPADVRGVNRLVAGLTAEQRSP